MESRAADALEHIGSGGLLLQRFAQFVEKPRVLNGDHRLIGERGDQFDLLGGEWINRIARQEQYANRSSLAQERNAKYGAIAPAFLSLKPSELGIGQNLRDVNNPRFQHGAPSDRPSVDLTHWESLQVLAIFGLKPGERQKLEAIVPDTRAVCLVRPAKSHRRLDQGVEYPLKIERRSAYDLEHIGSGGLLLQRFA